MDFEKARIQMVDCQIRTCDVTQHDLLSAIMQVAREEFVPAHMKQLAYIDEDIEIAPGRYLMEPAPFARLLQIANIHENDVVMVVGAGCGYSSAVFSLLASSVVAVEQNSELADQANARLTRLGFDNVAVLTGEHATGCVKEAPYDVIFVDGAVEFVPDTLLDQIAEGGRLVVAQGTGNSAVAKVFENSQGNISERIVSNCSVKPVPGFEKKAAFVF